MNKEVNTVIVNLYGAPGTGKSTTMAAVFAELKWRGADVEMAPEFAKDLVWENRHETLQDQMYIFGKQQHRIARLNGKVQAIICDSPILNSIIYSRLNGIASLSLDAIVIDEYSKYNNLDILLKRTKPYNPNGRLQTEEESNYLGETIRNKLNEFYVDFTTLPADRSTVELIADMVMERIQIANK